MVKLLEQLEKKFADTIGTEYAVVTSSGRMALEIAIKALDIKGKIIIPNLTCSVVPFIILKSKSVPAIVDITEHLALDTPSLEVLCDKDCKAIMPIFLYGCPSDDIQKLIDFANMHDLFIIEDVAQSFSAQHNSKNLGSFGDVGIFSFPKAFFDLFRGGGITTDSKQTAEKAKVLRDKLQKECGSATLSFISKRYQLTGKLKGKFERLTKGMLNTAKDDSSTSRNRGLGDLRPPYHIYDNPYYYEHLTDLEINRALHTLAETWELKKKRLDIAKRIIDKLAKIDDLEPIHPFNESSSYTRIPVLVKSGHLAQWIAFFEGRGIRIDLVYAPLSRCDFYRQRSVMLPKYEVSERLAHQILPLPVNEKVCELLN